MKKILISCILLSLLLGCSLEINEEDYHIADIMSWVRTNVSSLVDVPGGSWQLPPATIALGTGDCEDMALLMLYLVNEKYNIKGKLVIVEVTGLYRNSNHAVVLINGIYYDPAFNRIGLKENYEVLYNIQYDIAMLLAATI